jgi:predicted porin
MKLNKRGDIMKQSRMKRGRIAAVALLGAMGAASIMPIPAHAETQKEALKRATSEIATLKQELAEQRALIDKLLAAQNSQKATIDKIETRTAQAPAQVSAQAVAQTPAQAASSLLPKGLTWYATLDVNVANTDSGHGRQFTVGSGGMSATSIGFKGQKEVGNGLSVIGEVEMGADLSTGVVSNGPIANGDNRTAISSGGLTGTGNQIFSRQAYAGLASDTFGKLTLGRQYTGSYLAIAIEATPDAGPWGTGLYGNAGLYLPNIGGMPTRVNNSIVYRTPAFEGFLKGFSVHATYTAGSENNDEIAKVNDSGIGTSDSSGEGYDLALFYRHKTPTTDGLTVAATAWIVKNASFNAGLGETGLATKRGWQAIANYDFGYFKLYGVYVSGWYSGGNYANVTQTLSDADGWSLGVKVPYGDHTLMASYMKLDDKSLKNQDASLVGVTYAYKLANATWLYTSWGKVFNNNNGKYALLNGGDLAGNVPTTESYNPDGLMMGLLTKF